MYLGVNVLRLKLGRKRKHNINKIGFNTVSRFGDFYGWQKGIKITHIIKLNMISLCHTLIIGLLGGKDIEIRVCRLLLMGSLEDSRGRVIDQLKFLSSY